jgi:lipid-A-disaccharide synthase
MIEGGMEILISAGETSGDHYGAELASKIREHLGGKVVFFGVGGQAMARAGVRLIADLTGHSVVASLGFARHLVSIYSAYRKLGQMIARERPRLAVLVDTPTFNLPLARRLRHLGVPVIYFVSPQVWAWGKRRLEKIQRYVSIMIVIFPFEQRFYQTAGVPVEYFGHPLVKRVRSKLTRDEFFRKYDLDPSVPLISLLPGSRREEVRFVLPTLVDAASALGEAYQYVVSAAPNIGQAPIRSAIEAGQRRHGRRLRIAILEEDLYDVLCYSDAAAVCSGTATLEAALLGTPFVMVYRIARWRWSLRKFFVEVPYYCIVNLIAGQLVVKELMQGDFAPESTAQEIRRLIDQKEAGERMKIAFRKVREILDRGDAIESAARFIVQSLGSR